MNHHGSALTEPQLVRIEFKNNGRRDIQASDFVNGDRSLVFDLQSPIVDILEAKVAPSTAAEPQVTFSGQELRIHPFFVKKRQVTTLSVLVDGPQATAVLSAAQLLETTVRRDYDFSSPERRLVFRLGIGMLAALAITLIALGFQFKPSPAPNYTSPNQANACRYWDRHDPAKAKEFCPPVIAPTGPAVPSVGGTEGYLP
ncbi:hypothetical protein ACFV16_07160 [Streptomyces massasporeus]|uniref:hypothetical protein n=1 Tax=Streptomyces massasporeus TaxID=67324 RepID=UPI00367DDE93